MANYIEAAREAKNVLDEVQGSVTSHVATWKELFDESKREIQQDTMLSESGKRAKLEELQNKMGRTILELSKAEQERYLQALVTAQNNAKRELAAPLQKPDELDVSLNDQTVRKLELDAMFASSGSVIQQLDEYANGIKEPYFANQLLDKLPGLMSKLGTIEQTDKTKLKRVYDSLQDKALTDSKREAKQILGSLEGANTKLFKPLHADVVNARAAEYSGWLNNPSVKLSALDEKK